MPEGYFATIRAERLPRLRSRAVGIVECFDVRRDSRFVIGERGRIRRRVGLGHCRSAAEEAGAENHSDDQHHRQNILELAYAHGSTLTVNESRRQRRARA